MKQLLDPECVKKSIGEALMLTANCSDSIKRITGIISNLPPGKAVYCMEQRHGGACVRFYLNCDGRRSYLSKSSDMLYLMCRKRYLELLLRALKLRNVLLAPSAESTRTVVRCHQDFKKSVAAIMALLDVYSKGNLDIARIVLTSKQYRWYTSAYHQKHISEDAAFTTNRNINVRSKSEKDIGNCYEDFAVPYHYEEQMTLNVGKLVRDFEMNLRGRTNEGQFSNNQFKCSPLCCMQDWTCYWNVPAEYQGMNKRGSIWRAYRPNTGRIRIFNDFHIMLADGDMVIHEHEGAVEDFDYRRNASERVYVMRLAGAVSDRNLITTLERDVKRFEDIIRERILPRLWF